MWRTVRIYEKLHTSEENDDDELLRDSETKGDWDSEFKEATKAFGAVGVLFTGQMYLPMLIITTTTPLRCSLTTARPSTLTFEWAGVKWILRKVVCRNRVRQELAAENFRKALNSAAGWPALRREKPKSLLTQAGSHKLISVITPTFNGERFIETCILNVIEQSCPNAEHIIVDGGSTDRTVEVVKRYAASYPHIRWVSEKDEGQSDAMNKGIGMARGDVLGFLNVDDYYSPGVLNRVTELFASLPEPHLLVGNCQVVDDKGELVFINKPAKLSLFQLLMGPRVNLFPVNPSAYFYHASLHKRIGLYNTSEHYVMDLDFLLRAVQSAPATYVDEDWGNMRFIEGTKTYTDKQNDTSGERVEQILTDFRGQLPPSQRLMVDLGYKLYNNNAKHWRALRVACFIEEIDLQRFLKRKFALFSRKRESNSGCPAKPRH